MSVSDPAATRSRRDFLKVAGAATALSLLNTCQSRAANLLKPFEVSASVYAWELHDEGVENVLDNLQKMSAVNSVYLIGLMHPEKRPRTSDAFPHNPVRKTWMAEDSRVYWHPDPSRYKRIKPLPSDFDWLSEKDWARVLIDAARKRGMKTGVEISHTPIDQPRAEGEFADCMQRGIHGKLSPGSMHPICPNSPDGRQYIINLFCDLASRYDVDFLQWCIIPFYDGGADKSACFCDNCIKSAQEENYDLAKAREVLLKDPLAQPELDRWRTFRCTSLARLYKDVNAAVAVAAKGAKVAVHRKVPSIDLRLNHYIRNAIDCGVDLKLLKPHLNSLRVAEYTEQKGDPALMPEKRQWLTELRAELGPDFPLLSAISVRPQATPELIRQGVQIAVDCEVDGITLGHYDGAEFPMLKAIRDGLIAAKII